MPWFWTDEIAKRLVDSGVVEQREVRNLIERPYAVAIPEGSDPEAILLELLGRVEAGAA